MTVKRKQVCHDPVIYHYQVELHDELPIHEIDTADVYDQLLKHLSALLFLSSDGQSWAMISELETAYGISAMDGVHAYERLKQNLIDDCTTLTEALAALNEMGGRYPHGDRRAIFMDVQSRVAWLDIRSESDVAGSALVPTA